MREFSFTTITSLLLTTLFLLGLQGTLAQVMQSTNYRIQSDSVNLGGGFSSSTNYSLESTGGEVGTGELSSASYQLKAGYQQMQEVFISMTGAGTVLLSPSIPGISGGTSNGSTTVTITTDSPSGYSLTIQSSQSPSMQSGANTISDYVPGGNPDYTFVTGSTNAHLGYSPSGVDIVSRFKDNTVTCNTGGTGDVAQACWDGLATSAVTIAQTATSNHPLGATTTVYFRVGIGNLVNQPSGTYTATTTLTALPL